MEKWLKVSLLLCAFGFLKEFRPSEHFIYEFLIGPWRNITSEQVIQNVYPIATYSYLAQLIVVFLITDFLRYKPLIVTLGFAGIVIWAMLLWTESLLALQTLEVFYGTYMATEVAYYTYMYAKVPSDHYQKVTGHARAAILTGRFLSGIIGQVLVTCHIMDFRQLNYITFAAQILATIWSLWLPTVKRSIYFNPDAVDIAPLHHQEETNHIQQAFSLLWRHFIASYSNTHVIKWSLWYATATCGFIQVQSYMQPLWSEIDPNRNTRVYNGVVEAVLTCIGALAALAAGHFRTNWCVRGELMLAMCSVLEGFILVLASKTQYVFVSYGCYIVFGSLFHFAITVVSAEVAKDIPEDTYGLVFGFNTLVALALQTVLMVVVVDGDVGLGLDPRNQFFVYGSYFLVVGLLYAMISLYNCCKRQRSDQIA